MNQQSLPMERNRNYPITQKTIDDFLFSTNTRLTEQQKKLFAQIAIANNLNPFNREIYAIAFGNSFNIVVSYQTYIKRAEGSGKLNGWSVESDGNKATVVIHRKDQEHPFVWTAVKSDFDKQSANWKTMPEFMLKKVAIAQAFRLAFPNELGSLPYLQEEVEVSTGSNTGNNRASVNIQSGARKPRTPRKAAAEIVQDTPKVEDKKPLTPDQKILKQIYDQVCELCGNNESKVSEIIRKAGANRFIEIPVKKAFMILNNLRQEVQEKQGATA